MKGDAYPRTPPGSAPGSKVSVLQEGGSFKNLLSRNIAETSHISIQIITQRDLQFRNTISMGQK